MYCNADWFNKLASLEDELRFVLITSSASLHQLEEKPSDSVTVDVGGVQMGISVSASAHGKCVRCWHHREDVGAVSSHPELCGRCIENVEGAGEQRKYA